jgi:hypothetical protein
MPEDAAAGLVQDEVPQALVPRDEVPLLPERPARRRRDAADDDVSDLSGRMALTTWMTLVVRI